MMMSFLELLVKVRDYFSSVTLELTQCCHLAQCAGFLEVSRKGQEVFCTSQASCKFINSIININAERQMNREAEKMTSERVGT